MQNVSIARRYARALIEVASETGTLDKVLAALQGFNQVLDSHPELREMTANPAYTRAQRWTLVEKVLAALELQAPVALNLFRILVDRNRLGALPDITRIYRDLTDQKAGRIRGKVITAHPLAADSLRRLEESLERLTQRDVVLDAQVDPTVLGGVSAQVGSVVYDGTLQSQLRGLRQALKAGTFRA